MRSKRLSSCLLLLACAPPQLATDGESGSPTESSDGSETGADPCAHASTVIEADLLIESAEQMAALADVVEIRGDLRIHDDAMVELVGANCLERITGSLFISGNQALERIDNGLVRLRLITNEANSWGTGMFITGNPSLVSLTGLRALERVDRNVDIFDNPLLVDMSFDSLEHVSDSFRVGDASLPSLAGLSALVEVGGRLAIFNCDALVDLDGLGNLSSIGAKSTTGSLAITRNDALLSLDGVDLGELPRLFIRENPSLVDLRGLESITSIKRDLQIHDNASLSSLAGLDNLAEVLGGPVLEGISIVGNPQLVTLAGLEGLSTVGHLHLCDNAALTDLSALANLETLNHFTAIYNDALDDGGAVTLAAAIPGVEWIKVDANAGITPMWWDKPECPWNGDLICDEGFEFQGDVEVGCVQDCCERGGPTHVCADGTDGDDCQSGPIGPGG